MTCNNTDVWAHSSVGKKSGWTWLGSVLRILKGQNQDVGHTGPLSKDSEKESTSKCVGRIQFHVAMRLRSLVLAIG